MYGLIFFQILHEKVPTWYVCACFFKKNFQIWILGFMKFGLLWPMFYLVLSKGRAPASYQEWPNKGRKQSRWHVNLYVRSLQKMHTQTRYLLILEVHILNELKNSRIYMYTSQLCITTPLRIEIGLQTQVACSGGSRSERGPGPPMVPPPPVTCSRD
jgi:hypothetical protein